MRTLILLLFSLSVFSSFAQKHKDKPVLPDIDVERLHKQIDSSTKALDSITNSMLARQDSQMLSGTLAHNEEMLNQYMADQQVQKRKQAKWLWVRAALLLVTVALVIYGWKRKSNTAKSGSV